VHPATFLGRTVAPSVELTRVLAPFRDEVRAEVQRPIGAHLAHPLPAYGPHGSSPLGDVMLEAMRAAAGVEIAVQNRGGIRADLPDGDLTYGQVFEAMPFDNRVAVLELDAGELRALVAHLAARSRGALPLVSGLRVSRADGGVDVRLADGSPLVEGRVYAVATNDYLALGGEGLNKVLPGVGSDRLRVLDLEVRTALIRYLRRHHGAATPR
jgi:5'-nucleotidase